MEENFSEKEKLLKTISNTKEESYVEHEKHLQCHICKELFVKAVTLACSHTFCQYCINEWKKNQKTCPICRMKIHMQLPTLVIDNLIAKIIENSSEEIKSNRAILVAEREAVVVNKMSTPPYKRRKRNKRMASNHYPSKRAR